MKNIKQKVFYGLMFFSLFITINLFYKAYEMNEVCQDKKNGCKVMGKDITIRIINKTNIALRRFK